MLRIDFVTLFPEMVLGAMRHSIPGRAEESGLVAYYATNPRDFTSDRHRTVDDRPFGGGPGMLLMPQPLDAALHSLQLSPGDEVVVFEPWGDRFTQEDASQLAHAARIVMVCGHYEGIDQRFVDRWATRVYSIGDFVLSGGEYAALPVADAIVRRLPGALGDAESLMVDSHNDRLLSFPQFTRPADWDGDLVPEVLTSGNHEAVERFRRAWSLQQTRARRPDLFCRARLTKKDVDLLQ